MNETDVDIVIIGGGPAGMTAALVLSRTQKKIIVFDDPTPPRNASSHGVHDFLGLDGLLPARIREVSWEQINKYESAKLLQEKVIDIKKESNDSKFIVTGSDGTICNTHKVILAMGYHDVLPNIDGFIDCWSDTIIICQFCDGYENKERIWGVVPNSKMQLQSFPKMCQNWTTKIKVLLPTTMTMEKQYEEELKKLGIKVHRGNITKIHHTKGKVESVTLDSGEQVQVETLLWRPPEKPSPLIERLIENLGLELDESEYVKTDESKETNVKGLFAAGDVQGWQGALGSADAGGLAARSIARKWYN